jgi:drug/metabolite transporter (DMT)-like permease
MWSFIGVLAKLVSQWVDSSTISFFRFFIGIIFLGLLLLIKERKLTCVFQYKWIWIGAVGKAINYIFENWGVSIGRAYTQVLVSPISMTILVLISAFYFKEKITARGWIGVCICLFGVCLVSWNGMPLSLLLSSNAIITAMFVISSVGASVHTLSQKLLIDSVDSGTMNFSMFIISAGITALPLPFTAHITGSFSLWALFALIILGIISGISFYIYAKALVKISFLLAVLIANSGALFSMLWAKLIFNDPISHIALLGTVLFMAGIILLNLPKGLSVSKLFHAQIRA